MLTCSAVCLDVEYGLTLKAGDRDDVLIWGN